jgi:hypothetical protein
MPVLTAVTVVVLALSLAACGGGDPGAPAAAATPAGGPPPGDAGPRLRDAVGALCEARGAATSSIPTARAVFYDKAHDELHELARLAGPRDRDATAKLLEAKNAVETDFLYPKTWDKVAPDLATLDGAARSALLVVSVPEPPAC